MDLPTPLNGAKACETWLAGMMCTVHCNKGYGFANNPDVLYYCRPNGKWWNAKTKKGQTTPTPPDCSSKKPELRNSVKPFPSCFEPHSCCSFWKYEWEISVRDYFLVTVKLSEKFLL